MPKNIKLLTLTSLAAITILFSTATVFAEGSQKTSSFNDVTISVAADVAEGQLTLSGINETGKKIKLMVKKDVEGSDKKWCKVTGDYHFLANVIFDDGYGKYIVYAMINEEKNLYAYGPSLEIENVEAEKAVEEAIEEAVEEEKITEEKESQEEQQSSNVKLPENNNESIYLQPGKDIESDNSEIISQSEKLTNGTRTDREKIEKIYSWVTKNFTYDYEKYSRMLSGNYSDEFGAVSMLEQGKGVCYDYATLFTALCRASGIEAKVIKGYSTKVRGYHAWNEVYDSQSNEWLAIDITVDSIRYHKNSGNLEFKTINSEDYSETSEM